MEDNDDALERASFESPGEELERLARESLEAQADPSDLTAMRARCRRVIDLYAQGRIVDALDNFHAAWVLLCGESAAHFKLARMFARRAAELGEARSWTLEAMAWDRWLVASGKPQRFGTQILKQHGRWSLGAVDPAVSDLERAFYGVPPLYVQQQRVEQLRRQERA
ncbi:MAG: hypothetical protein RMK84_02970 [Oscillochloridaceae bacterium]|nr:hypothetical protein [Chloroflexaceae bacterium]MDW8389064.1 hypothetical protein [Oscillochloridaceae bacterium]